MKEWLFFSISTANHWREQKPQAPKCAKDFKPRKNERKSAWAQVPRNFHKHPHRAVHVLACASSTLSLPQGVARTILSMVPATAGRRLQALNMFLLNAHANPSFPADKIVCLSINRSFVTGAPVHDVPATHVVPAFDSTHRELGYDEADETARKALAERLIADPQKGFETWQYSVDELRPLMQFLLRGKLLRAPFDEVAKRILSETSTP